MEKNSHLEAIHINKVSISSPEMAKLVKRLTIRRAPVASFKHKVGVNIFLKNKYVRTEWVTTNRAGLTITTPEVISWIKEYDKPLTPNVTCSVLLNPIPGECFNAFIKFNFIDEKD